jgi:hypothetical protein
MKYYSWFILTIAQFTQVGFQQIGLKKRNILRMPHLPYSVDMAPIDFYLFPIVKEKLERIQLADEDQFLVISRGLDQQRLNTVFQAWVSRAQEMSEGNGGYVG